jgi:hypothetical protein
MHVSKTWFLFVLFKIGYMFAALFVYSRFTSLGDTNRYLSGQVLSPREWISNSTLMMDTMAGIFSAVLGPVLANLPFVFLSAFGVYYAVKRLQLQRGELTVLLLLLSFPSFGIWTSIASKEAVTTFFLGVILGFIIDILKGVKNRDYLLVPLAFYLCAVFKPQYLIAIVAMLSYLYIAKKLSLKGFGKFSLFFFGLSLSLLVLYVIRFEVNSLSFTIVSHFDPDASSTRENTIWVDDFDFFWNAPYGMLIAFVGPTFSEAFARPAQLFALMESVFILVLFLYASFKLILVSLKLDRINIFMLGMFLIPALWILFVHYPFGALNPGSAIRYRSGFYAFLVILFYFSYIETKRRLKRGGFN